MKVSIRGSIYQQKNFHAMQNADFYEKNGNFCPNIQWTMKDASKMAP